MYVKTTEKEHKHRNNPCAYPREIQNSCEPQALPRAIATIAALGAEAAEPQDKDRLSTEVAQRNQLLLKK